MGGARGVKRVKSGCVTCRIRRVKCDEDKPECKKCVSTGRKCDGYSTLPFSRRDLQAASQSASRQLNPFFESDRADGLLPRLITDPAFSDLVEKRYFQFFRQRTVASTNSIVDSRFWDRVVLQACHTEPAIKHAVLALSSLHQLAGHPNDSDATYQHRLYAEKQHHKALAEARGLISSAQPQDVDRILIACIVFIIFEGVRGDYKAAAMHMDSGRAIVAQNSERLKQASRRRDLIEIEHALARLDLPAICFSDRNSPYCYSLTDFYHTSHITSPEAFQDASEAQASFVDLMRWLLVVSNHIDDGRRRGNLEDLTRHQAEKHRCGALLEQWDRHFCDFTGRADQSTSPMILNLKIWYACATIMIKAEASGPETKYDPLLSYFQQIIEYGERLAEELGDPSVARSFSFELGYTIPIYFAAIRCRDPKLRRRAVALLLNHPRQEGVWESVAASTVAARWIDVEEDGLDAVESAADVPEYKRIRYIATEVEIDSQTNDSEIGASKSSASEVYKPVEVSADLKHSFPEGGEDLFAVASDTYLQMCASDSSLPYFDIRGDPMACSRINHSSDMKAFDSSSPLVKVEVLSC